MHCNKEEEGLGDEGSGSIRILGSEIFILTITRI